jgi:hypothetical protein
MYRTVQEQRDLVVEAERRVKAGEPRAEVARALGIPVSTVAAWAHRGGWRRKDLITVRDAEMGRTALEAIAELTAEEDEKKQDRAAKLREAFEASKAEFQAIAPEGQLPGPMGEGPIAAHKLATAMADSLLRQGRLQEADRAIRLAVRFADAEQAAGAREEAKWREERERLTKWWAEKQGAFHQLHQATLYALQEIQAQAELEASRSADECCPQCGRSMAFWPEEVERSDDSDESGSDDSDDDFASNDSDDFDDNDSDDDF